MEILHTVRSARNTVILVVDDPDDDTHPVPWTLVDRAVCAPRDVRWLKEKGLHATMVRQEEVVSFLEGRS